MVQLNLLNHNDIVTKNVGRTSHTNIQSWLLSHSLHYYPNLEGRKMVVTVDSSTTVVITRNPDEPECEVCSPDGSCSPTEKTLTNVEGLSLEFSCAKPQDVYSMKMKKKIGEDCGGVKVSKCSSVSTRTSDLSFWTNYTLNAHVWRMKNDNFINK